MSAAQIIARFTLEMDGFNEAVIRAQRAAIGLYWAWWWADWGTNGRRRSLSLVSMEVSR